MISLKPLPFHPIDLEPVISEDTVMSHYLGHHKGYVDKYNSLVGKKSAKREDLLFNLNGHKLHTLYWETLIPGGRPEPSGVLADSISTQYGGICKLLSEIIDKAATIKGSGWTLLLTDKRGKLYVRNIDNHDLSQVASLAPLVIVDAWEHAWYLDYAFKKKEFFKNFVTLINWDIVERRYLI